MTVKHCQAGPNMEILHKIPFLWLFKGKLLRHNPINRGKSALDLQCDWLNSDQDYAINQEIPRS